MNSTLTNQNYKKERGTFLRSFGSALVAVVIAVNAFGAFASLAFAAIPSSIQTRLTQAATYAQAAKEAATIAQNPATSKEGVSAAAVNAGNAQRQMLAEYTAARNELTDLRNRRAISTADFNEANTALTQAQLSTNPNSPAGIARAAVEAADAANRTRATASGDLDAQQRARALSERNTASTGSGASTGGSAGQEKKTATHPVDICFSKDITASICIASIFYVFFVDLTAPIAYLSGAVFDAFASVSLESGTYASAVIAKGWVIARDIANMAFVFILIYIALMLILNLEGPTIARQIAGVIAVALLINFSFFFTRVVIDMSNILAHEFYDQINAAPSQANPSLLVAGAQALVPISISEKVMAGVNPQTLISNDSFKKFLSGGTFVGNLAILITLFLIFGIVNVILAAVFLTAAFQFLARIVALWFAIILSPIAFISFITPKMNGIWTRWLKLLLNNAFYAPAFLFVIYIAVKMLDNGLISANIASFLGGAATAPGAAENAMKTFLNSIVGVVLRLSIIVGLFIAALKVGSFVGAEGADRAESWGKKLAAGGNGAIVGGLGGFVGRKTAGWTGNVVARSQTVRNWAGGSILQGKTFVGAQQLRNAASVVGRGLEATGVTAATSSFDVRASGIPGATLGGKAQSGGYRKDIEDRAKRLEALETARHDSPEEKEARKKAIKMQTNYASKEADLNRRIETKTLEEIAAINNVEAAERAVEQAALSNNQVAKEAAKAQLSAAKRAERNATKAKVDEQNALKKLGADLEKSVGESDKTRKEYTATMYESKGAHNLFGVLQNRGDYRAAANLRAEKSKEKKIVDDLQALLGNTPPPAAPPQTPSAPATPARPAGGGGTPPPAAGGGGGHH